MPATRCRGAPVGSYEQRGILTAELEPDRLAAQTILSRLVARARGDGAVEESNLLKGADGRADALLGQIEIAMISECPAVDMEVVHDPARG
jgi:hypothetical protein